VAPPLIDRIQQLLPPVVVAGTTASLNTDALQVVLSPFVPAEIAGGHATTWASSAGVAALIAAAIAVVPPAGLPGEVLATVPGEQGARQPTPGPDAPLPISGADVSFAPETPGQDVSAPRLEPVGPIAPETTALTEAGGGGLEVPPGTPFDVPVTFEGFAPTFEGAAGGLGPEGIPLGLALLSDNEVREPVAELTPIEPAMLEEAHPGLPPLRPLDWIITDIVWEGEPIGEDWEYLPEPLLPLVTWAAPGLGAWSGVEEAPPAEPVPSIKPPRQRHGGTVRVPASGGGRKRKWAPWPPPCPPPRPGVPPPPWCPPPAVPPAAPPPPPPPPAARFFGPFPPLGQQPQNIAWLKEPRNVGKLIKWGKWLWLAVKVAADEEDK
jgi:hypothetical protein